ncbi:tetratricopeptide repeat protein [Novipirellula artificiosorum]|nr:tetratricopeptide repeat protein [Novipirellula artificiosorum]
MRKNGVPQILRKWAIRATIVMVLAATFLAFKQGRSFFSTADWRGQARMRKQDYKGAAETFVDPMRQAEAFYRAGDFERAASVLGGLPGEKADYNRGNSLVMLGKYDDAVKAYDLALVTRPDWEAAKTNREIAAGRAERLRKEGGVMTGGKLGADEIIFTKNKNNKSDGDTVEPQEMSDEETRGLWLRQVQTTPRDFLKSKFAYQNAMADEGASDE